MKSLKIDEHYQILAQTNELYYEDFFKILTFTRISFLRGILAKAK